MCPNNSEKSKTLIKIAERLRLYQPNLNSDTKDSSIQESAVELTYDSVKGRASVLICLFEGKDGDLRVILTKRSSTLSSHSGEVSLPGGKWEEGDESNAATAVREAKEEIGLDPSIVEIVAVLEPFYSKSQIIIFPVIGIIWDMTGFNPILNSSEVESVFDAPLEMFLKNENRREQRVELMGYSFLLHFFDYQTENELYTIWGLTASILTKTASLIYQRPPAFDEIRPKFWTRSRH